MMKRPTTLAVVQIALSRAITNVTLAAEAARTTRNPLMAEKLRQAGLVLEALREEAAPLSADRRRMN
jgi:hypothetical protein